jgi:hypothetical protein
MRKTMLLAAIVAALGTISQPAEAHDRGLSFRHFSGHAGPKLRLRDRGPMFHQGFFGKPQPFMRRHFSDFGNGGLVRRFGDGDAVLKFGHVLPFKPRGFGHGHGQSGLFFRFDRPRQKRRWHDRGFVFKDPPLGHLRDFRDSIPRSQTGQGGGLHSAAPPEALLRRLEQMGFRHVPELLRESSR